LERRPWTSLVVLTREGGDPFEGSARLVELFRWLRGEGSPGTVITDATGARVTDPYRVNWRNFPLQDALDEIQRSNR